MLGEGKLVLKAGVVRSYVHGGKKTTLISAEKLCLNRDSPVMYLVN